MLKVKVNDMEDLIEKVKGLLISNHNLILTGAPGTGKTYLAKKIAESMEAEYKFVQFHPSYDYTDFVEGLRPINQKGQIVFERQDGVFKEFCKDAWDAWLDQSDQQLDQQLDTRLLTALVKLKNERATLGRNNYAFRISKMYEDEDIKKIEITLKNGYQYNLGFIVFLEAFKSDTTINDNWFENTLDNYEKKGITFDSRQNNQLIRNYYVHLYNKLSQLQQDVKNTDLTSQESCEKYVFIIDEINRGEISKIFGELFFSIDPGYRGPSFKVRTQYQHLIIKDKDIFKDGFFVPENVYIIGTMNDIDRSVESMDFAMRRRFAWKEISAESSQSMLDEEEAWGKLGMPAKDIVNEIKIRMDNLNDCIIDKYGGETYTGKDRIGLTKAYQIGASYFLKYNQYNDFDELWANHIEGLLYEYLRGTTNVEAKIVRLKDAYNDTEAH